MDKIIIKGLTVYAYHGVNPEEKTDGQHFVLDIVMKADIDQAKVSDDLNDTVNYAAVKKTVLRVFTEEKFDLIEKAAKVVADAILDEHKKVQKVKLTLKKPEAPMSGTFNYVAVTIKEKRNDNA